MIRLLLHARFRAGLRFEPKVEGKRVERIQKGASDPKIEQERFHFRSKIKPRFIDRITLRARLSSIAVSIMVTLNEHKRGTGAGDWGKSYQGIHDTGLAFRRRGVQPCTGQPTVEYCLAAPMRS